MVTVIALSLDARARASAVPSTSARRRRRERHASARTAPRTSSRARASSNEPEDEGPGTLTIDDVLRASPAGYGATLGMALLVNRALSGTAPVADASSAQSRADVLGLVMAATLILTGFTWIALKPRAPNVVDLVGASIETPYVTERASAELREELAWTWDTARRATNCDVMAVFTSSGERVMQAGIGANALGNPEVLRADVTLGPICAAAATKGEPNYLANLILFPGRVEFESFFPVNTQAVCVRPIGDGAVLVIGSRTQRGLTPRDQRWFAAVAQKLDVTLDRGLS